ncbi:hypothetical protein [Chitinophaga qingshengii]|uniref:Uncharacterized protein n=1 Tax=Chitinophaga qingshengii TaxID=1569794 RepID=A0ABR7TQI0_9BACT|nr:hypothetical protein [Chitinophaga qingshengii]MBC9932238.1 hypothetical protein [Chitinophaga qingshengii]
MKRRFVLLILLLISTSSTAQFAGYYTAESVDGSKEKVHLILEETGRFHIFGGAQYHIGKWKMINANKVSFEFGPMNLVDLFVSSGNGHAGQICFSGFGERKAFVHMGQRNMKELLFRPVYGETPKCPYENNPYTHADRHDYSEITVAIKLPAAGKDSLPFLYTWQIPEKYDEVYLVVNNNAFPRQRDVNIEYKNGRYMLGNIELQKQNTGSSPLSEILKTQLEQSGQNQEKAFRKELYVKKGAVEKITPQISRKAIQVTNDPVIVVNCPGENAFPPVAPPPVPRKQ